MTLDDVMDKVWRLVTSAGNAPLDISQRDESKLRAAIEAYAAEQVSQYKQDAERYRWLRGDSCPDHSARWTQWEVRRWAAPFWTTDLRQEELDTAIDAAIRDTTT